MLFVLGAVALDVAQLLFLAFIAPVRAEVGFFAKRVGRGCSGIFGGGRYGRGGRRIGQGDCFAVVEVHERVSKGCIGIRNGVGGRYERFGEVVEEFDGGITRKELYAGQFVSQNIL